MNVLPDVLELMFAREAGSIADGAVQEQVFFLLLPTVLNFISPGQGSTVDFCDHPVVRSDGKVTLTTHMSRSVDF